VKAARASLEEILRDYPEEIRALDVLARSYTVYKQPAVALRRIREHAAAHPKSAHVQHYLGIWLERNGALAEARAAFGAAKAADATFWRADLSIAAMDVTQQKFDAARKSLLPLLSHPDAWLQARTLLAAVERSSGNLTAAVEHYRKLIELQPDNVFALNNLAYALAEYANSPDEALKIAERAKELAPDNPAVDDTLGWVLFRKGIYTSAVQHLENSVKRGPTATRHAHLAIAYAARGDRQRGLEQLQAAIKLNQTAPEVVAAQKLLAAAK
jgi:Tfp pilus assembly protein PilF